MQIQFNTDDGVQGTEGLRAKVEAEVRASLDRFAEDLTRIEIHLTDENQAKGGERDKRCMIEARPRGGAPLAVTHHGATLEEAWEGAAGKMERALDHHFGKLGARHGRGRNEERTVFAWW
jgi:ribosome-associated translation inhibitor RaiA